MSEENRREIYKALREEQKKYTYFLLAVSGAAIALAVNKTQMLTLECSQAPLAFAVLSWGTSFYFGCRNIQFVCSTLYANAQLLNVEDDLHPEIGNNPQMKAAAIEGIRQAINSNSDEANNLAHWQFRLLIAGAVLYIFWHVFEMYLRGNS